MPVRSSEATWNGGLKGGNGEMEMESGSYKGAYTYASRFEEAEGTNPEELIAAAFAGCFSMKLAGDLESEDYEPERVHTVADVHLEGGTIARIVLHTEASVPGIDEDAFQEIAESSKENCPVSKALAGPEKELDAKLAS